MRERFRLLGIDLLQRLIVLLAASLMLLVVWFTLPALLDLQAGRVGLADVSGRLGLGVSAAVAAVGALLLARRLTPHLRRRPAGSRRRTPASPPAPGPLPAGPLPTAAQPAYPAYWPELRQLVLDRDGYRCGNCGSRENLHVHHIVPLTLGGSNEMGNLRTLCRACHARLHPHMRDAVGSLEPNARP